MLIAIIGLCIVAFLLGYYFAERTDHDDGGIGTMCGSSAVGIICIVCACILTVQVVTQPQVIKQKIELYEEQNARINDYVSSVVTGYQNYEGETYGGFKISPEQDALTLVATYPQLQSDTLVAKQIDIYLANQKEIISLQKELIDLGIKRWWLYFGPITTE